MTYMEVGYLEVSFGRMDGDGNFRVRRNSGLILIFRILLVDF
jgi:hypothetical protein